MNIDLNNDQTNVELQKMFSKTIDVLDTHPPFHHFATERMYEARCHKHFLQTLREELGKLDKMCATEKNKTEMGILARSYNDRIVSIE